MILKDIKYKDILNYLVGNYRYFFFYSWLNSLFLRDHIAEQIAHRIRMMKPECYERGTCVECGCRTTALQMANKACEGACYPSMFSKNEWKLLREGWIAWKDEERWAIEDRVLIKK